MVFSQENPDVTHAKDQLALPAETGSSSASSAHKMAEDDLAGLPRLDYRIPEHWKKLSIITFLFVLESSLVPVVFYYGLTRGTSLRPGISKPSPLAPPSSFPLLP